MYVCNINGDIDGWKMTVITTRNPAAELMFA
jgi:hypothetical protein